MNSRKYDLMSEDETAQILGIDKGKLYSICDVFDKRDDDQWDLIEGEHFEWLRENVKSRRFYEEGAMAIAKYLEETTRSKKVIGLLDRVIEQFTHRRKRTRQMLVRRRVIQELQDSSGILVRGDLVFFDRRRVIRILRTNGKGLNAASTREQNSSASLKGRASMEIGVHFDEIEGVQYWSQRGLARIAKNMSENLSNKSRRAWTEAVTEIIEDAIHDQRKHLLSFEARVQKAMDHVKARANNKCQVTLVESKAPTVFNLHAHHLFDRSTRPDLAAMHENLLVMHEEMHRGFHNWHGSESCEPKHLIEFLTTVESWRFEDKKNQKRNTQLTKHLHNLINRLEKLQTDHENQPNPS